MIGLPQGFVVRQSSGAFRLAKQPGFVDALSSSCSREAKKENQVAARFYAQARTEVADRASQERTLNDTLVGTTVGTIQYPVGTKMGTIGAKQETSKKRQECIETQQKKGVLKVSDGVNRATDSIKKWTILDSIKRTNPRERQMLCRS